MSQQTVKLSLCISLFKMTFHSHAAVMSLANDKNYLECLTESKNLRVVNVAAREVPPV